MEISSDEDEEEGQNGLSSYLDQAEDCIFELLGKTPKLSGRFGPKIKAIGYAEVCLHKPYFDLHVETFRKS